MNLEHQKQFPQDDENHVGNLFAARMGGKGEGSLPERAVFGAKKLFELVGGGFKNDEV